MSFVDKTRKKVFPLDVPINYPSETIRDSRDSIYVYHSPCRCTRFYWSRADVDYLASKPPPVSLPVNGTQLKPQRARRYRYVEVKFPCIPDNVSTTASSRLDRKHLAARYAQNLRHYPSSLICVGKHARSEHTCSACG